MFIFKDHLKALRKNKGFTQKQLADLISVSERGYQRYEAGKDLPGFEVLVKLADALGVSLDYLMGRDL